jgi:hypothetical protein
MSATALYLLKTCIRSKASVAHSIAETGGQTPGESQLSAQDKSIGTIVPRTCLAYIRLWEMPGAQLTTTTLGIDPQSVVMCSIAQGAYDKDV